jgi:hypothetical protein
MVCVVAQLVETLHYMLEVAGSIPVEIVGIFH